MRIRGASHEPAPRCPSPTDSPVRGTFFTGFDDLWHPLVAPDGPPGAYFATLDPPAREAIRDAVWERLERPRGPFRLDARAWYVTGRA